MTSGSEKVILFASNTSPQSRREFSMAGKNNRDRALKNLGTVSLLSTIQHDGLLQDSALVYRLPQTH